MTKKLVFQVDVNDAKQKQKALKAVSGIAGIESLALDMKEKKLTVVGDVDPVEVVSKLRKTWYTSILTVGPAKEPEKKKEDDKKDDKKKDECMAVFAEHYNICNPHMTQYYHVYSSEEDPNSCVIC